MTHVEDSEKTLAVNVSNAASNFSTPTEIEKFALGSNLVSLGVNATATFFIALKAW